VREVWSARVGPVFAFKGNQWAWGPRATPAVHRGLVYALGGQGELVCVEAATGAKRWRVNLRSDLGGEVSLDGAPGALGWGYTSSPLVDGDRVVCVPGGGRGTLAALDRQTGKVIWRSKDLTDLATYASPITAVVNGVRQYVLPTHRGVAGVATGDGRLLWHYEKPVELTITSPLLHDRYVYATAFYRGCHLIELTSAEAGFRARKVYANRNITNQHGGVVLVGEHLYGFAEGKGWVCQEFRSGDIVWSRKGDLGRGSLLYADGRLYCYGEDDGDLALVGATPAGWKEHGRLALPRMSAQRLAPAKVWTHPVVANGRLYLRDQELLFCFDVSDHPSPR